MNQINNDGSLNNRYNKTLLQISWGAKPQTGAQLSPEFTIISSHQTKPRVEAELDDRLDQEGWNTSPQAMRRNSGHVGDTDEFADNKETGSSCWSFIKQLNIRPKTEFRGTAVFMIKFKIIFNEIIQQMPETFEYAVDVSLSIKDPNTSDNREIIIDAADGALVNTDSFDWSKFDRLVIKGSGTSLVNLSKGISDDFLQSDQNKKERDPLKDLFCCFLIEKERVDNFSGLVPFRKLTLKVTDKKGEIYYRYLHANTKIKIGRAAENDILYKFYQQKDKSDRPEYFLSNLVSRKQCVLSFKEEGLGVKDECSGFGTDLVLSDKSNYFLQGTTEDDRKCTIHWDRFRSPMKMILGKTGCLIIAQLPQKERTNQIKSLLEKEGFHPEDEQNYLWKLGSCLKLDALKVVRSEKHVQNDVEVRKRLLKDLIRKNLEEEYLKKESEWKKTDAWKYDSLAKEEYYIVFQSVTIGSADGVSEMFFDVKNQVKSLHASIFFCDDCFGLVNNAAEPIQCKIITDQDKKGWRLDWLHKDGMMCITPGLEFDIGDLHFEVCD